MFNEAPCSPTVPLWWLQFGPTVTQRKTKLNRLGRFFLFFFLPDHKRHFDLEIRLRNLSTECALHNYSHSFPGTIEETFHLPRTFIPPLNWSDLFTVNWGGPFVLLVATCTLVVTVWICTWSKQVWSGDAVQENRDVLTTLLALSVIPTCWKHACTKFSGKRFRIRSNKASTLDTSSFFFPWPRLALSLGFPGWISSTRTTPRIAAITVVVM